MTGGVAAYGQMEWEGIKVASGMQPTVLGQKIDLVLVDTKSDKIEAANAVKSAVINAVKGGKFIHVGRVTL